MAHEWCPSATEARFWKKVDRSAGLLACWPWTGCFNKPSEAGRARWSGGRSARPQFALVTHIPGRRASVLVYAHRLSLALADGVPIYDRQDLEACHRPECSNPACVNPAHLYWGTPEQNRADRYGPKPGAVAAMVEGLGSL